MISMFWHFQGKLNTPKTDSEMNCNKNCGKLWYWVRTFILLLFWQFCSKICVCVCVCVDIFMCNASNGFEEVLGACFQQIFAEVYNALFNLLSILAAKNLLTCFLNVVIELSSTPWIGMFFILPFYMWSVQNPPNITVFIFWN